MKRIVLLAGILMAMTPLFAQNETTETRKDTTIVTERHEVKIIETQSGIKVKVFEKTEDNIVEMDPIYESRYKDGQYLEKRNILVNLPFTKEKANVTKQTQDGKDTKKPKICCYCDYYPTVYFSYSMLSGSTFGEKTPDIQQRPFSFEWGLYPFTTSIYHNKNNTFGFTAALGISNTYNYFNNSYVLATDKGNAYMLNLEDEVMPEDYTSLNDINSVSKSYLRYWSLRLPVSMQLQWKVSGNVMCLAAGPEFEWRFGMRSVAKYDGGKHFIAKDINYNPLAVNALVQIGFEEVRLIGRVALTEIFEKSDLYAMPFSVGIGLAF